MGGGSMIQYYMNYLIVSKGQSELQTLASQQEDGVNVNTLEWEFLPKMTTLGRI